MKLTFASGVTFYLTKSENRTKKSLQYSSHTISLSKGTIFATNAVFLLKDADISKVRRTLVLKGIFFETKFIGILMHQFSSF